MSRFHRHTVAWFAAALMLAAAGHAQSPKPKPKRPSTGGAGSGKLTTTPVKPPYDGPATLLFQIDMACRIWIDGTLAITAAEGDVKPIKVSLGEHLVKVESTDGTESWQRAMKVERAEQEIVPTNLVAQKAQEDAARAKAAADAEAARARAVAAAEAVRQAAEDEAARAERERRAIARALDAARSIADSSERLQRLVVLEKQYPDDNEITAERRHAAEAVGDDVPRTIAAFLNSLGKMLFPPDELTIESSIEYRAEAKHCGLAVDSTDLDYRKDASYSQRSDAHRVIAFSKQSFRPDLADVGTCATAAGLVDCNNPSVVLLGVQGTVAFSRLGKASKIQEGTQSASSYFVFPPAHRADAMQFRDQLETLSAACSAQDP